MYSQQSDLETRISATTLARLCNDDNTDLTKADYETVKGLIARADAMIDAKVSEIYQTPLVTPIDLVVKNISVDLSIYFAYQRQSTGVDMPKSWDDTYKQAMATLDDIADEVIQLSQAQKIVSPEAVIVSPPAKFSHERLENF